ncbi:V-type sodium pump subunit C [Sedimentisphaera cyanobacteriorum]|uniref:V-type sodium pump subunit C n=1 Tax=Sedimentisphaera cyanobacteriorum TaxID=1940790 RepID=A0A1Q2HNA0_9BACT|nr:V-type ATPase subunit [Sedimentisphaera cyanobacteriorum]AQQ08683.1 V-type sodium pump subunit C [Sedimentisphaera cyanobacteriorum]
MQEIYEIIQTPRAGKENWDYAYHAGLVRAMQTKLLPLNVFADMASAGSYREAIECTAGSDYGFQPDEPIERIYSILADARNELKTFFKDMASGSPIASLPEIEADMSNLRLAVRRFAAERPIGEDYSNAGTVPPEQFESIFESDDYSDLPAHFRQAAEESVLEYYATKDLRSIDYAIDRIEFHWHKKLAQNAKLIYLSDITAARIDLTNIGMVIRSKFAGSEEEPPFIAGGFVDIDKLKGAMFQSFDVFDQIFYSTDYEPMIVSSVDYLNSSSSFVRFEALCEQHLQRCCDVADYIAAGLQPLIAFYYRKLIELRWLRIVITAKKNGLSKQFISDRLGV